ncbi:MAG: hypothetical protein ABSF00_07990 [Candidatus Bathyarchaeia archaeon]|jgi:hypothetical protein
MHIPKLVQAIATTISSVIDLLVLLDLLGFIQTPIFHGAEIVTTNSQYFILLALVIFGLLTFWLGYQFSTWRNRDFINKEKENLTKPNAGQLQVAEVRFPYGLKTGSTSATISVTDKPPIEIDDFRNGVATEVRSILTLFSDPLQHWNITYPIWSSKADASRAALLGIQDYFVLRLLYDAIEGRNRYFAGRLGMDVEELEPLNLTCVKAFSRAYSEVSWLKTESYIDSLLAKARKAVGLR